VESGKHASLLSEETTEWCKLTANASKNVLATVLSSTISMSASNWAREIEMESWFHRPVGNASPMLCYSPKCSTCLTVKATLILCLAMINSIFKLNAFDWRFSKLFKERLQKK